MIGATADAPTQAGTGRSGRKTARSRQRSGGSLPHPIGLLPLIVGLALWQLLGNSSSAYVPRPSAWLHSLEQLWSAGQLMPAFWATVSAFLISLAVATIIGAAVGLGVGRSVAAGQATKPLFEFCRAIPPAAIVPLAVLFGGYSSQMEIAVVVFTAIWPILLTVERGARDLHGARVDLGRSLHLTRMQNLRKILIPSVLPFIVLGVRVAAPIVLIIVLLVEILTQIPGLGGLLSTGQTEYLTSQVYGVLAIACALGLLTNVLVSGIEHALARYQQV